MIQFLYANLFDSGTATASSVSATYTGNIATNVQNTFLKQTWRSSTLANEWLKFDLGSAKQITLLTSFYNNLTTSATVKIYAHTSDLGNTEASWATAGYQSGVITNFDNRCIYAALNQSFRWWLISFSDSTNSNGYIEIGRVYAGISVSPDENFNEAFTENLMDGSEILRTQGGSIYSVVRERYKTFNFEFRDISTANQTVLKNLWNTVYKTEPFVIAMDGTLDPVGLTRYGQFAADIAFQYQPNARANVAFQFMELR